MFASAHDRVVAASSGVRIRAAERAARNSESGDLPRDRKAELHDERGRVPARSEAALLLRVGPAHRRAAVLRRQRRAPRPKHHPLRRRHQAPPRPRPSPLPLRPGHVLRHHVPVHQKNRRVPRHRATRQHHGGLHVVPRQRRHHTAPGYGRVRGDRAAGL